MEVRPIDANELGPNVMKHYHDNLMKPIDFGERTLQWFGLDELPNEGDEVIVSVFCDDGVVRSMNSIYEDGLFHVSDQRSKEIRYWSKLPEPASMIWPKPVLPAECVDEMNGSGEELSLNTLRDEIYKDAVAHGLWEEAELDVNDECVRRGWEWEENLLRSACAQKIWDEAVELDEAWKSREHYSEELADVIIMSMSIAGKLGIDIDAEIRRKMEINRGRPWKHGK